MISLIDNSEPEPAELGTPCTAEDIAFWKDVLSVLLPPDDDAPASAQDD